MARSASGLDGDRDSSESKDELTALKSLVLDGISDIHSNGSFATFGSYENFVHPGICVDKVGAVRLPLLPHDAQTLIQASRQAPFGKGNQTLVDETVRKTWEIEASNVSFSNKAWHGWLENVVRKAAEELGVAGGPKSVRAELYKMLLYEKGAMFKPHKDTEKTSGMFGTLVICLPSEHVGGAVRLTHGQEERKFTTAELSAFNTTYIAWYADVTHEIEPVQTGYRWVLTYNLINTSSGFPQSAAGLDAQLARFCQTLTKWRGLDKRPECLCYALDHQYTDAGLKLATLKGDDYYRARYVADACNKVGDFCALLASMQKVVTFPNGEEGEEYAKSFLRLDNIVDLEGHKLGTSLKIPNNILLQQRLYISRLHDSQIGGEYTGNDYANFDQLYNNTVMLILPKVSTSHFLLGMPHTLEKFKGFLLRLQNLFQTRNKDQHIRELIVQTCQDHIKFSKIKMMDLWLGPIAVATIVINDQGLFRKTVRSVTNGFDESSFSGLGELIDFRSPMMPEDDLVEAFSKMQKLHTIRRSLLSFRKGFSSNNVGRFDEHQVEYLTRWIRDRVIEALKSIQQAYPQDAAALIEISKEYDDKIIEEFVKPFIARFGGESSFSNALAVEILGFSKSSRSDQDLVARLFLFVLDAAASQFGLQQYSSAAKTSTSHDEYPYSSWPECQNESDKGRSDASLVVDLHQRLLQADGKKASELLGHIQSQTESLSFEELDRLVIPLLEQMIYIVDLCPRDACQFYQSIMATYITRVVQKEPEMPRDWARPNDKIKCDSKCKACQPLQEFLADPGEESREFVSPPYGHFKWSVPDQCTKSEDLSQTPPVYIVTKTLKGWEEDYAKWQERASKAQEVFQRLPQEKLRRCLAEKYDEIMDLRMVKLPNKGSTSLTNDTAKKTTDNQPNELSGSTVPQKRARSDS